MLNYTPNTTIYWRKAWFFHTICTQRNFGYIFRQNLQNYHFVVDFAWNCSQKMYESQIFNIIFNFDIQYFWLAILFTINPFRFFLSSAQISFHRLSWSRSSMAKTAATGGVISADVSLPNHVLDSLFQRYSIKQRRAGLESFLVASILFDLWALLVPQGSTWFALGK